MLEETLSQLDALEKEGPGAETEAGETIYEVLEQASAEPGALKVLVDRYSASSNVSFPGSLAFILSDHFQNGGSEDAANLIYTVIERMPHWDNEVTVENCIQAVREQFLQDLPWDPPEPNPPSVLPRFLVHCLGTDSDDIHRHAFDVMWKIHQWAESQGWDGGIKAVLQAEDRTAIKDKIRECGLEGGAGPVGDLLA